MLIYFFVILYIIIYIIFTEQIQTICSKSEPNMNYSLEYIAQTLKDARKAQGLSQADLGAKAGIPQSHISKVENGDVDLRISSLVELARVLKLELELVPRGAVTAVRVIADMHQSQFNINDIGIVKPAYSLDDDEYD